MNQNHPWWFSGSFKTKRAQVGAKFRLFKENEEPSPSGWPIDMPRWRAWRDSRSTGWRSSLTSRTTRRSSEVAVSVSASCTIQISYVHICCHCKTNGAMAHRLETPALNLLQSISIVFLFYSGWFLNCHFMSELLETMFFFCFRWHVFFFFFLRSAFLLLAALKNVHPVNNDSNMYIIMLLYRDWRLKQCY